MFGVDEVPIANEYLLGRNIQIKPAIKIAGAPSMINSHRQFSSVGLFRVTYRMSAVSGPEKMPSALIKAIMRPKAKPACFFPK